MTLSQLQHHKQHLGIASIIIITVKLC